MTSGTIRRLAVISLALAADDAAARLNSIWTRCWRGWRARRPTRRAFVEVRYSSLLETPLVVVRAGSSIGEDGALVRRVESPYQEVTELRGENVSCEREPAPSRAEFSLDRAPELRGMLASFGALLQGDRAMLDRYFVVAAQGTDARWAITLTPRDAKLQAAPARPSSSTAAAIIRGASRSRNRTTTRA